MPREALIELRRGTAAAWTLADPVLEAGEPGFEIDTGKVKIGDGTTAWTSLPYLTGGGGSTPTGTGFRHVAAGVEDAAAKLVEIADVAASLKPSGTATGTDESLRRLGTGSTHAAAGDDSRFPTAGEKNALAGTSGTPGSLNKYVTDGDSRLTGNVPTSRSLTAGSGLSGGGDLSADRTFDVSVDGSTLEIATDSLRVKASGITANEIAANAVGSSELADDAVDTNAIQANAVTAAKVAADVATQAELDAVAAAAQPLDADLTAVAALDSSTSGAIASDGAGWIKKTYAQFKTALSLVKADVGLGNVDNTADTAKPVSTAQQTAIDAKVTANGAITGETKTKITYDTKGLVTAGADATTADIADSTNKRYVTDAQLTVIGNTSGTNTGDQSLTGLVAKTLYDANTILKADSDDTPLALTMGASTILARLASGGIVAATPAELRTLLALVIGTDVQAWDADLDAIAALTTTSFGRSLLTQATAAAARDTIGVRSFIPQSYLPTAIAESLPRWAATNNGSMLSNGRLSSVSIPVLAGDVLSSMSWCTVTSAVVAPTNWWFALCDSSFNVIRQTRDQLTAAWAANTLMTLACDEVPVTAGARVASSTVTLTFPTLSVALSTLFAVGDSITVSNANIAAYNGTFTVASVSSTQITYVSGGSATDTLAAPFPTVRPAAAKRAYTVPADGLVYAVIMLKATVPTLAAGAFVAGQSALVPVIASSGDTSLTGTCPSPIAHGTTSGLIPWAAVS